jgi:hypothetical protein
MGREETDAENGQGQEVDCGGVASIFSPGSFRRIKLASY